MKEQKYAQRLIQIRQKYNYYQNATVAPSAKPLDNRMPTQASRTPFSNRTNNNQEMRTPQKQAKQENPGGKAVIKESMLYSPLCIGPQGSKKMVQKEQTYNPERTRNIPQDTTYGRNATQNHGLPQHSRQNNQYSTPLHKIQYRQPPASSTTPKTSKTPSRVGIEEQQSNARLQNRIQQMSQYSKCQQNSTNSISLQGGFQQPGPQLQYKCRFSLSSIDKIQSKIQQVLSKNKK